MEIFRNLMICNRKHTIARVSSTCMCRCLCRRRGILRLCRDVCRAHRPNGHPAGPPADWPARPAAPTAGSPASPTACAPAGLPAASQPGSLQARRPTRRPAIWLSEWWTAVAPVNLRAGRLAVQLAGSPGSWLPSQPVGQPSACLSSTLSRHGLALQCGSRVVPPLIPTPPLSLFKILKAQTG